MSEEYTAKNIVVFSEDVVAERFGFAKATQLLKQYPQAPEQFVKTAVEAAVLVGVKPELVMKKYYEGQNIELAPEYAVVYAELSTARLSLSS